MLRPYKALLMSGRVLAPWAFLPGPFRAFCWESVLADRHLRFWIKKRRHFERLTMTDLSGSQNKPPALVEVLTSFSVIAGILAAMIA
jgi:hypothetical protein